MHAPADGRERPAGAGSTPARAEAERFAQEPQRRHVVARVAGDRRAHPAFAFGSRFADQHGRAGDAGRLQARVARLVEARVDAGRGGRPVAVELRREEFVMVGLVPDREPFDLGAEVAPDGGPETPELRAARPGDEAVVAWLSGRPARNRRGCGEEDLPAE